MQKASSSIAFIICTEEGILEKKSILFAKSLRKYGGKLKDAPVYSICPRKGYSVNQTTLDAFKSLNVIHIEKEINTQYQNYTFANKIEACVFFENNLNEDVLIFCDSDQLILGDLSEFCLKENEDLAMQVVAIKGIGTNGVDENANYWKQLHQVAGTTNQRFVQLINGERIFEYYNAGLIIAKRKSALFQQWKKNFQTVMSQKLLPHHGLFFVEQSVLSATISSMNLSVKPLPKEYNDHFLKHSEPESILRRIDANKILMLHYHHAFDQGKSYVIPKGIYLKKSEKLDWLNETLRLTGLNDKALLSEAEVDFDKNKARLIQLMNRKANG